MPSEAIGEGGNNANLRFNIANKKPRFLGGFVVSRSPSVDQMISGGDQSDRGQIADGMEKPGVKRILRVKNQPPPHQSIAEDRDRVVM